MKKTLLTLAGVFLAILSCNMLYGQIDVQSDGAIKLGELDKATNVSGSSLDIAVNKIYVCPTANPIAGFSIYNNSPSLVIGGGAVKAISKWNNIYQQTYMVPVTSGGLVLGTSASPLGNIYAGTVYASGQQLTSDRRAKQNIHNLENSTSYLLSLKPVRFDFNQEVVSVEEEQASNKIGFIAQDVRTVLPELVYYDTLSDLYSMDYVSLIPVLTKGFQEQDSVIRRQQALLEAQAELIAELAEQLNSLQEMLISEKSSPAPKKKAAVNAEEHANVLYQNTPNPFNQETRIRYELSKDVRVAKIVLYDMNGLQLKVYGLPLQSEGTLVLQAGSLPAGIYLYGLVVDGVQVDLKRMVLMD